MSSNTKPEPKITPVPKSELLLDVASEATILRSSEGISMVVIPNHPTKKKPVSLLDSFDFILIRTIPSGRTFSVSGKQLVEYFHTGNYFTEG